METTVQHYVTFADGAIIDVLSCDDARGCAGENGHGADDEGRTWWIEWGHYGPDGEPVAGSEWPCGC